jgi:hypothetical protein
MPTLPVDIVNRAFDECGIPAIADLTQGRLSARVAERHYWPTVKQLLSAAHWNFARKEQPMNLLADLSGQLVPDRDVMKGWSYMYEWPTDCVHPRWVPSTWWSDGADISTAIYGISTGPTVVSGDRIPTPFIVSNSPRTNPIESQWYDIEGHDPDSTRVMLTNQPNATLIYTGLMMYPDNWDPLFEQAVVAALAVRFALPLIQDRKEARIIRADNIAIARAALDEARVRDGNEGWSVYNHVPDWIRTRWSGWGWGTNGELFYGWTSIPWLESAGGVY